MPADLTVILEHRPGELARLGEITGEAGVSIRGLAAFTGEGRGVVHLLLDDQAVARCREALERAGMGIADQREVLVVGIEDRLGALGELTRQFAEANVNIELAYTTFGGVKVVIATDDLTSARAVLPSAGRLGMDSRGGTPAMPGAHHAAERAFSVLDCDAYISLSHKTARLGGGNPRRPVVIQALRRLRRDSFDSDQAR